MSSLSQESNNTIVTINGVNVKELQDRKTNEDSNVSHPMDFIKLEDILKMYANCPDNVLLPVVKARCPALGASLAHVVVTENDRIILEMYFKDGWLHSPDSVTPALLVTDQRAMWYKHGLIHNAHGPAEISLEKYPNHPKFAPKFALEGQRVEAELWWMKKQQMRQKTKKRFIEVIKTSVLSKSSAVCNDLHPVVLKYL
jgi:hypothetical protein